MMYRICPNCGSHLDPSEICDCVREASSPSGAGRTIRTAAYNEVYSEEYSKTFQKMKRDNLPACIADDIADTAAKSRATGVSKATAASYQKNKRRASK
ncbi:hypothetical protein [Faecalispora jeddahensis]|uniref:hypothetical protein n=1 Tax=Faecalispora jeddahensis TaxID=1414721 RepID=UPI0027BA87F0|nr:hypothetical protein [Faecalispora jeddahensis]